MQVLIGCDPEVFVREKATGKLVSAYGMVEGTKDKPFKVEDGAVQVDGMALEFNINPAASEDEFVNNVTSVMGQLDDMIGEDYELVVQPVANFGSDYIKAQPEVARELGCDPDFNAYTGMENDAPNEDTPFRTAAGHIHVGWTEDQDTNHPDHIEACRTFSKHMDYYVGLLNVHDEPKNERRNLYGKAGSYRAKPYGVEYRTPSNVWLLSEERIRETYRLTKRCFDKLLEGKVLPDATLEFIGEMVDGKRKWNFERKDLLAAGEKL